MPDNTPQPPNSPKKARLGRGLGSLLSPGLMSEEAPAGAASPVAAPAQPAPTLSRSSGPVTSHNKVEKNLTSQVSSVASTEQPSAPPVERKIDEQSQIWKISIDQLRPNTQQPRQHFQSEALKELTASIREKGILQPIVARRLDDRNFEIIAGERRWRAAQAAGLHEVPVILKKVNDQDSLELAIIENIQRHDLNSLEEAEAYQRLLEEYRLTQQQIAERVGKDRATVANTLRLLSLPHEVKVLLKNSELSTGHAKALLALDNQKLQAELAKKVVAGRLSVRATEKLVTKTKMDTESIQNKDIQEPTQDVSKRVLTSLTAELQKTLGTKVTIDYDNAKGKLSVHFYSDDELNHIIEKLRTAWQK